MSRLKKSSLIGIVLVFIGMSISFAFASSEKPPCVPQAEIIALLEEIPKVFPISEKDNIYIIEQNSHGMLTATIDDLKIRFFDSRNSDPQKQGTVSNKFSENAVEQDLNEIGCVVAGVNYHNTGEVDTSKGAIERAQKLFNAYVSLTQNLLKK